MGGSTLPQVIATLLGARVHEGVHGQRFGAIFRDAAEDHAQAMAVGGCASMLQCGFDP